MDKIPRFGVDSQTPDLIRVTARFQIVVGSSQLQSSGRPLAWPDNGPLQRLVMVAISARGIALIPLFVNLPSR